MLSKKIFCMCLHSHHLNNLKKLNYIPVGLGKNQFSNEWLRDDTEKNISEKNSYYGEYTFYYWIWKNLLNKIPENTWVGFSGYRYHWSKDNKIKSDQLNKFISSENFKEYILRDIPEDWKNYDVVLGEKMYVNNWKLSKILKHAKLKFLRNPGFFLKKNQNIKLHFDVFHGEGYLDKAISLLDEKEKEGFKHFVNNENAFNRENLFFCRSKKIMNDYFESVFKWLEKCENEFGFNLEGYALKRIYAFLAERYLSYWFQRHSKHISWPIFFHDTNLNKVKL